MIRIIKGDAPAHLIKRGTVETAFDHKKYEEDKAAYDSGKKKFDANDDIYNSDHVRDKLVNVQNEKCCYCETKDVRSNRDVEHYRPKRAYSSERFGKSMYPGYFWLAYDWDNLFLSCQVCNQVFKNDFFPIEDESKRAQKNNLSIDDERAIIIHPFFDEPEKEISYRESIPFGLSERGEKTIEYLGFGIVDPEKKYSDKQRAKIETLVKKREEHYNRMKILFDVVKIFSARENLTEPEQEILDKANNELLSAQQPDAEWSVMIKCAVADGFKTF